MPESEHKGQEGPRLTREDAVSTVSAGKGRARAPVSHAPQSSLCSLWKKRVGIHPKILYVADL